MHMCSIFCATSPAAGALELLGSGIVRDREVSAYASVDPRCLAGGALFSLWGTWAAVETAFLDCHSKGNRWASSWARKSFSPRARECLAEEDGRQEVLWRQCFLDHTIRRDDRRGREGSCWSRAVLSLNGNWKSARLDVQLDHLGMQMGRHGPECDWSVPDDEGIRGFARCERSVTGETVRQLSEQGQLVQAIEALGVLLKMDSDVSKNLLYAVLRRCLVERNLVLGRRVHALAVEAGYELDTFLCNHILRMYAGHARLQEGMDVFTGVAEPDAFMWSSIISAHVKQGRDKEAIQLYHRMRRSSVKPDGHVFVAALQACARGADLETGQQVHADVLASGTEPDLFVSSCLVDMYAKCGSLEDAQRVFDTLGKKNVVIWTALITGYAQQGMGQEALHLYSAMREEGAAVPDSVTFVSLLQACASVGAPALEKGKQLHAHIREQGHQALIAGYSQQGMGQEALCLYSAMQEEGLAVPDSVTFVCLLQACTSVGNPALEKGKQLHVQIRDRGLQADVFVASSLVNMYAKCGSLEDAQEVFHGLDQKNVVTWSSMIAGYSQQGMGLEALRLYRAMQGEGMAAPDSVAFVCLLQACASVAALHVGRQLHAQIQDQGLQGDVTIGNSLITMYANSGSMLDAQQVFDALPRRDVVTWSALIAGYTRQGDSEEVFDLFLRMRKDGIQPDSVTFLSVLSVCSHTGLVDKGREYFDAMSRQYGITPSLEHYACMVDLLGRAGRLQESLVLVSTMPVLPTLAFWHTLLGACQKWSNVDVGRYAFDEAVKLDKKDAAAHVLMSNIYTGAQLWEQAQEMQSRRVGTRAWKQPGRTWWTDMDGLVHSFSVGDEKHPNKSEISLFRNGETKMVASPVGISSDANHRRVGSSKLLHLAVHLRPSYLITKPEG